MRILIFGASGMVGQSVLRECLMAADVEDVLAVVRTPLKEQHSKLRQLVLQNMFDTAGVADQLAGFDACLFTLGVSSVGMSEDTYTHLTLDLTVSVARVLVSQTPATSFIYLSGAGTDSTEKGRSMWARVKGRTENQLLELGFRRVYLFRLAALVPARHVRSKTHLYQAAYFTFTPILRVLRPCFPKYITTSEHLGRAMLRALREDLPSGVIENKAIEDLQEER